MTKRDFVKKTFSLCAAAAALPIAALSASPTPNEPELRKTYRLNAQGCNPVRVRLLDLKKGDLFIQDDNSGIWQCVSDAKERPAPVYGYVVATRA